MPCGSRHATRARSETAVYLALGIDATGRKDVLGLWIEQSECAKFWLKVFNDIKQRGVTDILIAVVVGIRGFPETIGAKANVWGNRTYVF